MVIGHHYQLLVYVSTDDVILLLIMTSSSSTDDDDFPCQPPDVTRGRLNRVSSREIEVVCDEGFGFDVQFSNRSTKRALHCDVITSVWSPPEAICESDDVIRLSR